MKITIQEFKSLIREAIVEQKSSASTKLLKQSLLELSSAIAELESEGFWGEYLDDDAEEPDNSSDVWDQKIDAVNAAIDANDFASVIEAAPALINVAKIVIEIYKEESEQLEKDVLLGAQFALSQLKKL